MKKRGILIYVRVNSKGGKTGATKKCVTCNGRGFKVAMRQVGMGMLQQMQIPCDDCGRTGEIAKDRCKRCKGKKVTVEKKFLDIYIEKGMTHGQKIVQKGEGDQEVWLLYIIVCVYLMIL